jgi:predicted permease
VALLVCAGLLGQSFFRLLHVEFGFDPDHLATLQVQAPDASYKTDEQRVALDREVVRRLASLAGVNAVGTTSILPVSGNGNTDWIRFVGRPYDGKHIEVNERDVTADFFRTLHAKLLRGRLFTDEEDASRRHVVIINEALAQKYFPHEDPIGKQIGNTELAPKSLKEIIGVVGNIREGSLDEEIWPAEYHPFNQDPGNYICIVARTAQDPQSMLPALAAAVHRIDPALGTFSPASIDQIVNDSPTAFLHRFATWLMAGFAVLALLLGVVGLYGVVAYSASQRTREIGVRVALGAQRGTVYRLICKEAVWLAAIGIAVGLACSVGVSTLMRKLLFGVEAWDPATLAGVTAVLATAALLASFVPAYRAAAINPVEALRAE